MSTSHRIPVPKWVRRTVTGGGVLVATVGLVSFPDDLRRLLAVVFTVAHKIHADEARWIAVVVGLGIIAFAQLALSDRAVAVAPLPATRDDDTDNADLERGLRPAKKDVDRLWPTSIPQEPYFSDGATRDVRCAIIDEIWERSRDEALIVIAQIHVWNDQSVDLTIHTQPHAEVERSFRLYAPSTPQKAVLVRKDARDLLSDRDTVIPKRIKARNAGACWVQLVLQLPALGGEPGYTVALEDTFQHVWGVRRTAKPR